LRDGRLPKQSVSAFDARTDEASIAFDGDAALFSDEAMFLGGLAKCEFLREFEPAFSSVTSPAASRTPGRRSRPGMTRRGRERLMPGVGHHGSFSRFPLKLHDASLRIRA
jgi:hypothetical protein